MYWHVKCISLKGEPIQLIYKENATAKARGAIPRFLQKGGANKKATVKIRLSYRFLHFFCIFFQGKQIGFLAASALPGIAIIAVGDNLGV